MSIREEKCLEIQYTGNYCTPFVRQIINSTFLVENVRVEYVRSEYNASLEYKDLIFAISKHDGVSDLLNDAKLILQLETLLVNADKLVSYIIAVDKYLFNGTVSDEECIEKWRIFYGKRFEFRIKNLKVAVNELNHSEKNTYLELFEAQEENEVGINNATFSLIETIPCEVDSIADIGSGPGIVNRHISNGCRIIAIDTDEEILKKNSCETCIGDILNLPLCDESVDMAIACDVIEHIHPDKLNQAINELKRVSKKFFYVQVPNEEILRYGMAFCPNCENVWHVNHHKSSFDLEKIEHFQDENWEITRVNYTGDVDNRRENPKIYKKIDRKPVYRVKGFTCPKCGAKSVAKNEGLFLKYDDANKKRWRKKIVPHYSEIGVLFKRKRMLDVDYSEDDIIKYELKTNRIDFDRGYKSSLVYNGKEQIPFINSGCNKEGILNGVFLSAKSRRSAVFFTNMPVVCRITICGYAFSDGLLSCYSMKSGETLEYEALLLPGEFELCYWVVGSAKPEIIIYHDMDIALKNIEIEPMIGRKYSFYCARNDRGHMQFEGRQKLYYLVTKDGVGFGYGKK